MTFLKLILLKNNDGKKLPFVNRCPGKKWYTAFFRRNPELVQRNVENLSKGRAVLTEETIRKWFKDLKYLRNEGAEDILFDAPKQWHQWQSSGTSGKVVAPRGYKNVYQIVKGKEKEALTCW